jgi:hypothetical protein
MAFFYPLLNSWVLTSQSSLTRKKTGAKPDTCANNLHHVKFPLTFKTEIENEFAAKLSRPSRRIFLDSGRDEIFPR